MEHNSDEPDQTYFVYHRPKDTLVGPFTDAVAAQAWVDRQPAPSEYEFISRQAILRPRAPT